MLYMKYLLELIGFNVELPMLLEMDNLGAGDIPNSWVRGHTHHMDVHNYFLHVLNDQGMVVVKAHLWAQQ